MLWSGAVVDIPGGWHLCDGNEGTPNLTTRFVLGSGGAYNPGDVGGDTQHQHIFTGDGHMHDVFFGAGGVATGSGVKDYVASSNAAGTTNNYAGYPSYYSLAYIMKL